MKLKDLAYLAVRILSIYLFLLGLSKIVEVLNIAVPTYLQVIDYNISFLEVFLVVGVPGFILILFSMILWLFAEKLSVYLIPKNAEETEYSVQAKDLEGFVLSLVGLILMILSFTMMVRQGMNYNNMAKHAMQFDREGFIFTFTEEVIRFLIGIILLFKAEGFALLLRKIRNMGLKRDTDS